MTGDDDNRDDLVATFELPTLDELMANAAPIRVAPTLCAPRPGCEVDASRFEPLADFMNWDPDDWRANREDFTDALQARADEVGYDVACGEVAKTAIKHLRNVRLRVDADPRLRFRRDDVIARWRESEEQDRATRTIRNMQRDRMSIAYSALERLGVPEAEAETILRAWRELHGIAPGTWRDAYPDVYPGEDELAEIVASRRKKSLSDVRTKPSENRTQPRRTRRTKEKR